MFQDCRNLRPNAVDDDRVQAKEGAHGDGVEMANPAMKEA